MKPHRLALFDLDHTLLSGDSDVLWCEFLMDAGLLDREEFGARNVDMESRYRAGAVSAEQFCAFYAATLAGRTLAEMEPLRRDFFRQCVLPRIPLDAMELVQRQRRGGARTVMTTATNRFITELTARHFGVDELIATELELQGERFTGRTHGVLNMREGKVRRLHEWLQRRGDPPLADHQSIAYSDSINDLPLLEAVKLPVAVDPDPSLEAIAQQRGWPVLHLHR